MSERRCICVSASNRGYIARTQGTSPAHCGPGSPVQPAQSARSRLWAAQSFPRPLHSHGSIRARMKIRLARQPGGCTTRPREHTTSAHIAVADITCKRRRGRTPGAVTAVTERCRCGLGPRFRDAEQVRSDELHARRCWHHVFERSESTVGTLRSVTVVLTRQLECTPTVTFTRGPLSVCIRAVNECVERRRKTPAAESMTYKNASWTSGLLVHGMQAL